MASQLFKFDFSKRNPATPGAAPAQPAAGTPSTGIAARPFGTAATTDKMEMSNETFNNFRNLIYKLCGIYFTDSKKYLLEGRIVRRLVSHKMRTFDEYYRFVESPAGRSELNELFEAITINETFFFRAPQQFEAMEKIVIPELISDKKDQTLPTFKIWIAASSTGEEAYTIAIIILEKLRNKYPNVQFQIFASDIDRVVLETAKKGIYKEYAIRNVPKDLLAKYFKYDGTNYILSDQVKRLVRFSNINLYDAAQMRQMRGIDVVFCCNVLIYFDMASKQQVISYIYDSLNKGGYLFIGYSESLHGLSKAFQLVHLPKAMAYKKE
ncbi:MAG: protein-glutamate O-methyltransferase CheR [Ignavibacteria bacterium]|jgi:chemotaxis protein methyltransferase CheR|nr:protein-glutamate O-methyltransferase CheR [Ignavibacteria bacterium]